MKYPYVCYNCGKSLYFNEDIGYDAVITADFAEFLENLCVHCYEERGYRNLNNETYKEMECDAIY